MKKLLNFLIPLCLFVSSGFSQLEVQVIEHTASHFLVESNSFSTTDEAATFRASNQTDSEQKSPISIEQEEEDETETSRNSSADNDSSSNHFVHNFLLSVQERSILSKYFTYLPSYKSLYILFEVFRI